MIAVGAIVPNRYQPREIFDEESLGALAESIAALGVLQPILVRASGEHEFELIAGERRWRAARRAGLVEIPALVQESDDVVALEQAVVENLHRENLNVLEEAAAYRQLIDDFGLTHDELAGKVGKSRVAVTNILRMLQLPSAVQRLLVDGQLSAGHARALLGVSDRSRQEQLAKRAVTGGMTVRDVEEMVRAERTGEGLVGGSDQRLAKRVRSTFENSEEQHVRPAGVVELEELLGNALNTAVSVELGKRSTGGVQGGRVVVSFGSLDDLERIFRLLLQGEVDTQSLP
jgi:ParB family chromosome partitioning protein